MINILSDLLAAVCVSLLSFYIGSITTVLIVPLMIVLSVAYVIIFKKCPIELAITAVILAFGISYSLFALSVLLMSFLILCLTKENPSVLYSYIFSALIQLFLMRLPFKIKRLRKGMPFLISKGGSNAGVIISVALLCGVIVLFNNDLKLIYIIPWLAIIVCAMLVVLWWRSGIKRLYLARLKEKELRELLDVLKERDERIQYLEKQNGELAKIIHKDNKLIPAMELAVKSFLLEADAGDAQTLKLKGGELLERLEDMFRERSGIVRAYQAQNKRLPSAGVSSVDALMSYMLNKALASGADFDLAVSGSAKYMVENVVSEADLNTLLADLMENALKAVEGLSSKRVLVNLAVIDDVYVIDVYDSGSPFPTEVLKAFGHKKITTRASEGGGGIGLMTLHDILLKYGASFVIDELISQASGYTKRVSVRFDRLGRYTVNTRDLNSTSPL